MLIRLFEDDIIVSLSSMGESLLKLFLKLFPYVCLDDHKRIALVGCPAARLSSSEADREDFSETEEHSR